MGRKSSSPQVSQQLKQAIDESRLFARYQRMVQIGALAVNPGAANSSVGRTAPGVDRMAFSVEDLACRSLLINWAEDCGLEVYLDEIANLSIRRPGRDREAAPVTIGGYIDAPGQGQPHEGLIGALVGLEVLEALVDMGLETERSVEMTVWSNTQGERFGPALMGSQVKAGGLALEACRGLVDDRGIRLDDTIERMFDTFSNAMPRSRLTPIAWYIEPILDPGPTLAERDATLGLITGVDAMGIIRLRLTGRASSVPNTARDHIRDPLRLGLHMIHEMEALIDQRFAHVTGLRSAISMLDVEPFKPGLVPERVSIDWSLYGPDDDQIQTVVTAAEAEISEIAAGITCHVDASLSRNAVAFDADLIDQAKVLAHGDSIRLIEMSYGQPSNAGVLAAGGVPAVQIAIPNRHFLGVASERVVAKPDLAHLARLVGRMATMIAMGTDWSAQD
ncbi:MAG: hypothetical protein AAF213_05765 [Pseudomonadota bacterium]